MKIIIENMKTKWQWLRSVDARGYKRGNGLLPSTITPRFKHIQT
jgi:hypothetical protein